MVALSRQKEGFPEYLLSVSVCLRRHHKLKRLPAEWLCFRMYGLIWARYLENYAPIITAGFVFDCWESRLNLADEFQVLFVALVTEEQPKEDTTCLPTIAVSSGISNAPDGTEGK